MKRRNLVALVLAGSVVVAMAISVVVFLSSRYEADGVATSLVASPPGAIEIDVQSDAIAVIDRGVQLRAELIFYPGGKVDPYAYIPLAAGLAARGIRVWIIPMPSDLAVLGIHRADRVLPFLDPSVPLIVGGHSLGGAMAAQHLFREETGADGLIMLSAYPRRSVDLSQGSLRVLAIVGSNDRITDPVRFEETRVQYPPGASLYIIEGANHSGMGNYGQQRSDGVAELSPAEQQAIVADLIIDFVVELDR